MIDIIMRISNHPNLIRPIDRIILSQVSRELNYYLINSVISYIKSVKAEYHVSHILNHVITTSNSRDPIKIDKRQLTAKLLCNKELKLSYMGYDDYFGYSITLIHAKLLGLSLYPY